MDDKFLNKKVDDIMQSIDGIKRASPRPFLFTRLEARMENEKNIWATLSSFVAKPVVALICICFIVIINAMVIFMANSPSDSLTQQGNELAAADEYSQVSTAFYEFENPKP